jgi:type II secretory pathway component GspD/PulD (secretin)
LFKILSIVKLLDTRPEDVTLDSSVLECKVTGIENLGADTILLLNLNEMDE